MVRRGSSVRVRLRASSLLDSALRGLLAHRRAARLRRRDPRLLPPRVRDAGAAREADQRLHRGPQRRPLPQDGRAGLARGDDPRRVRRLGRRHARGLPVHGGELARPRADRRLRHDADRRRGHAAVRHRRPKARPARRHRPRRGRGDRDDRARGRLGRRLARHLRGASQRRLRDPRPEGVLLQRPDRPPHPGRLPHHQGGGQAPGPVDDLDPDRRPEPPHRPDRHHGRPRDRPSIPGRGRGARRARCSARSTRAGPS